MTKEQETDALIARILAVAPTSFDSNVEIASLAVAVRDALAWRDARLEALEKALRDVRAIAGDRERFVMQGPRGFVAAVHIVDEVLGELGSE